MSVTGRVSNGVVVLPPGTSFPEGSMVEVTPMQLETPSDPLLAAVEKIAKPRPHWPDDYVLNHGHYVTGEPKKS